MATGRSIGCPALVLVCAARNSLLLHEGGDVAPMRLKGQLQLTLCLHTRCKQASSMILGLRVLDREVLREWSVWASRHGTSAAAYAGCAACIRCALSHASYISRLIQVMLHLHYISITRGAFSASRILHQGVGAGTNSFQFPCQLTSSCSCSFF